MIATINVIPQQSLSSELGPDPGIFKFTRSGNISDSLTVNFSATGSATGINDYLIWENQVIFAPGADTAFVTVLPRNDTIAEGSETVVLTINNSPNYQIGSNNRATVTIQDYFRSGRRGVGDPNDPLLPKNLNYLEANIVNGQLLIKVGIDSPFLDNLEIFLDTDQDSRTGDYRPGYLGGAEYRIDALTGIINDFILYRLPTAFGQRETLLTSGAASLQQGMYTISIPINRIGNPRGVDVIARTHVNNGYFLAGNGDRVPNYGALDTISGQVVVRQPGLTQIQTITDPTGDTNTGRGFDLNSLELRTIADQFSFNLDFVESFNPTQLSSRGPVGHITVDSDHSLTTGGIYMGDRIPTWGGDVELFYNLDNSLTPQFLLFFDPSGGNVSLDSGINDARWLVQNSQLNLSGSLSLLDAFIIKGGRGLLTEAMQRVPSNGGIIFKASTFGLLEANDTDKTPNANQALDTVTRSIKLPYVWNPNQTITRSDPLEYSGIADVDFTQVQTQLINNNLVVKGTLSNWLDTSVGIFYQVLLDTDLNANTGELIQQAGAPAIGADYTLHIAALEVTVPYYEATFWKFPNQFSPHEAWLLPQPGRPGNWTVTIPLQLIDNLGPQLRFLVSSGQFVGGYGRFDLAPPQPIVVNLNSTVVPTVTLNVNPSVVTENSTTNLVYTFTRTGSITTALNNVNFRVGGTATFNNDYSQIGAAAFTGTTGRINFAAGSPTASIIVNPTGDTTVEPNETAILTLATGTGYTVGAPNVATGTITDNDVALPTISVRVSPTNVTENGNSNLVYTFTRSSSTTTALNNVNFRVGGTATFNNDYRQIGAAAFTGTTGRINFLAGSPTASITVDPTGDTTVEPNETAILTLATGTGYTVGTPNAATGTITNDDRVSVSTFRNTTNIIINDNAPGTPYPSNINVSGVTGTITKVTATLKGVSHTYSDDFDILLTGPNGQKVMLMSDAGGDLDLNGVNLGFDSSAGATLPDSNQIVSGTYRPTNFDSTSDIFPSPAPGGTYGTNLGVFNNISPNGAWKLFVKDDLGGDIGAIAQGWELAIQTA